MKASDSTNQEKECDDHLTMLMAKAASITRAKSHADHLKKEYFLSNQYNLNNYFYY